jgi:hypothetical protein
VKKIFTRVVVDIATGRILEAVAFDYPGKVAECKGASSGSTTTALPRWLEPYAQQFMNAYQGQVFDEQGNVRAQPAELNQQVAGFNPYQESSMQTVANMTGGMQDIANLGAGQAANTISGQYLNPDTNPYIAATYDRAARQLTDKYSTATAPSIMATAQRGGNYGGSAMDETMAMSRYGLGENLADLGTSIYGGNYAAERGNQLQTLQQLPQTMNATYMPQQNLYGLGAQQQQQQQTEMDTAYQNALNRTQYGFEELSGYGSALGQAGMGTGSSRVKSSGAAGMFGTAACSACHDAGLMDDETWAADEKFGASLDPQIIDGYHLWSVPLSKAMRRSPIVMALVAPIVLLWAREMKKRVTGEGQGSLVGSFMLLVGIPLCRWLGRNAARSETVRA